MPDPVTAWMVHLERKSDSGELEGRLQMQPEALVFTASGTGEVTTIAFANTQTARRIKGSPVLVVGWVRKGQKTRTAFYFSKPPPLKPPERPERISATGMIRSGRPSPRRQRRENVGYLSSRSGSIKPLLQTWAQEATLRIKQAKR